ncbi:hypothetical protein VTH82DRAFT_6298 [Thermothelomyces myriococcoides]
MNGTPITRSMATERGKVIAPSPSPSPSSHSQPPPPPPPPASASPPPSPPTTTAPTITSKTVTVPDSTTEITHLYLTFATPLPHPNTAIRGPSAPTQQNSKKRVKGRTKRNGDSFPAPPNLEPYANPQTWPSSRKYLLLFLSCLGTWQTAYTAGAYSPPQRIMQAALEGHPSVEAVLTGITTFCLGFAFAPMVLAPLSEMNGRYPVFVAAGVVYVVFQAVCAVVTTLPGMVIARLFVGIGASVFSTMVGGVIADMWDARGRNTPMALFSGSVLVGTGVGPLVGAVMAQRMANTGKWRWIFWHQVIMAGAMMLVFAVFFRESRGSVLLSRKAKALNRWYEELEEHGYFGVWVAEDGSLCNGGSSSHGDAVDEEKGPGSASEQGQTACRLKRIRWRVKEDEERATLGQMIVISVSRPFHFLFTESVVFFFSLWVAFAWGVLYLTFGSIPLVYQRVYGWTLEDSGYVFSSLMVGAVFATAIGLWQDRLLSHPKWAASPASETAADINNNNNNNNSSSSSSSSSRNGTSNGSSNKQASSLSSSSSSSTSPQLPPPSAATSPLSDRIWAFLRRKFPASAPESRLYFTCITSTFLPIGLFIFGFSSRPDTHWIGPAIGMVLATMGILSVYLAVFNYFADAYHTYASSALAAQSFCRNVMGGAFPLVTRPLFINLGPAKAGAVLGSIGTALTVVPWVLVFFGEKIRARSPFASRSTSM